MLFLDTVEVTKIIGKACNVLGCRDFNFTGNYYDRVSAGELKYIRLIQEIALLWYQGMEL